jgi:hypothetical protein
MQESPFNTLKKIDIHAHILPESWPDLKQKYGYGGFVYMDHHKKGAARMMKDNGQFFREVQENCWSPEAILVDMDKHNVDMMVLCTLQVLFKSIPTGLSDWVLCPCRTSTWPFRKWKDAKTN